MSVLRWLSRPRYSLTRLFAALGAGAALSDGQWVAIISLFFCAWVVEGLMRAASEAQS